jgi:NitT/TauT family transport system substrate-binding protein
MVVVVAVTALVSAACSSSTGSGSQAPPAAPHSEAEEPARPDTGESSSATEAESSTGETGADSGAPADLKPLPFRLNWTAEAADHPWFYAGIEQGLYAAEGIDLKPEEGSGSATTLQLVASGSDPIGLVDAGTMINGVSKGMKVRSVCTLAQLNPMAFIFRPDAGINSLEDLKGKTIAYTPGDALAQILPAVLAANGMTEDDFVLVGLSDPAAKQNSVLTGAADAFMGYFSIQKLTLEQSSGKPMDSLSFADLGVNTLSMSVIVNTDWEAKNKDLVQRFVAGTQAAAAYVQENEQAAADDFVAQLPNFAHELALKQIKATVPLLHTDASKDDPICYTEESDWVDTQKILNEYAGLNDHRDVGEYYTNEYVSK